MKHPALVKLGVIGMGSPVCRSFGMCGVTNLNGGIARQGDRVKANKCRDVPLVSHGTSNLAGNVGSRQTAGDANKEHTVGPLQHRGRQVKWWGIHTAAIMPCCRRRMLAAPPLLL